MIESVDLPAFSRAQQRVRRLSFGPGTEVSADRTTPAAQRGTGASGSAASKRPHRRPPSIELEGEVCARRRGPGRSLKVVERLDARKLRGKPSRRGAAADEQDRQWRCLAERAGEVELVVGFYRARPRQHLLRLIAPVVGE